MTKTLARSLSLGLVLVVVMVSTVEARSRRGVKKPPSDSRVVALLQRVIADNESLKRELVEIKQRLRPDTVASIEVKPESEPAPSANPAAVAPMPIPDHSKTLKGYEHHIASNTKLKNLTPKLADKVAAVLAACPGSRLVSDYRRGARVRGSGRPSLHSYYPSRAADLQGNPECLRKAFAGWPGGLSTDYSRVNHYHASYAPNSREWGARFAHYRGARGHRVARRTHHSVPRYARAVPDVQTVASVHAPH